MSRGCRAQDMRTRRQFQSRDELAASRDRIMIRDSKDRTGRVLRFTPTAWRQFAEQLKAAARTAG